MKAGQGHLLNVRDESIVCDRIKEVFGCVIDILGVIVIKARFAADFDQRKGGTVENPDGNLTAGDEFLEAEASLKISIPTLLPCFKGLMTNLFASFSSCFSRYSGVSSDWTIRCLAMGRCA
jgi:hypothetical protein